MQFQEFLGQVQARARLSSLDDAMAATRATLQTLAERVGEGDAESLGAQLPTELKELLKPDSGIRGERFDSSEFFQRVAQREHTDPPAATYHARVVLEVCGEAMTPGQMHKIRDQLPEDYQRLFEAGSEGKMPGA